MSIEDASPDSLQRATRGLRQGLAELQRHPELPPRDSEPFLKACIVGAIVLGFCVIVAGYLSLQVRQFRAERIDMERQALSGVSAEIQIQLDAVHNDVVAARLDPAVAMALSGDDPQTWLAAIGSALQQADRYEFVAILNPAGVEVGRLQRAQGQWRTEPGTESTPESASLSAELRQSLRQSDFATAWSMPTLTQAGNENVGLLYAWTTAAETAGEWSVLLAYRAAQFARPMVTAEQAGVAEYWLLDGSGRTLARAENGDWRWNPEPDEANALASIYPATASILTSERTLEFEPGLTQPTMTSDGVLIAASFCLLLSCESTAVDSAGRAAAGDTGALQLLALIPAARLSGSSLLGSQIGRWLPVTLVLVLITAAAAIACWFVASSLLTLRRQQRFLEHKHSLQEVFFEENPEILFVKNLDGTFCLANRKCRELAEAPGDGQAEFDPEHAFPIDPAASISEQDRQVIEREEAMEFQSRWQRDGIVYHFKTLRFPMYDSEGQLFAIGGSATDVTDQVQNRLALIENEKLLRTFLESAPDAVLISDTQGLVTLVNRQAELVFDFDREEMLEQSLFDLISGLKRSDFDDALEVGRHNDSEVYREVFEAVGIGQHNRHFPVELSLAPVNTDDGSLMICLLRDVSDKALMETQLRQSQKMEAIGKLTGGMAHDFNNLLGIIVGNIALALRDVTGDERLTKRLETAHRAADRGAELTKRMLAVARRQPLQPKPVGINDIIEELSEMLPQTLGADIEMRLELEPELPSILVDESGFESTLLNLAINSRDAMPRGGSFTISTHLKSREDIETILPQTMVREQQYVHVAVSDTGAGMSEEALNRAFEPFFTTKEKGKGTGLGLAMIYGFVKQSHGYIVIDSKMGEGTTVNLFLPPASPEDNQEPEPRRNKVIPLLLDKARTITILLVDDEPELLEIAESYLQDMGFTVFSAEGGRQALALVEAHPEIDLLITDVVMPEGLDGPALAQKVREQIPHIGVLYASGFPAGVIAENAGVELDAPLMHKPYTRESLASSVMELLSDSEAGA